MLIMRISSKRCVFLSFILILTFFLSASLSAQKKAEVGIFGGTSYYLGDINHERQFYSPSFAGGLVYRYNLDTRYALRANAFYGGLKASDKDFSDAYQQLRNASFSANLIDLSALLEFNFLSFKPSLRHFSYTTYVDAGLGAMVMLSSTYSVSNVLTIPFGVGFKIGITDRLVAGIEWNMRKTFDDNIDGVKNSDITMVNSMFHESDWHSFAGITITYRFFDSENDCPAYERKKAGSK
jgi:hypothetical protein